MKQVLTLENVKFLQDKYVEKGFNALKSSHRAVFSDKVHPSRTDEYVPIPTALILASLVNAGLDFEWEILKQDKSRKNAEFAETKPIIVAVYFNLPNLKTGVNGKFAMYIINSANGQKLLDIVYGWLNGACLNGCIWGDVLERLTQKHIGKKALNIQEDVDKLVAKMKAFIEGEKLKQELQVMDTMLATPVSYEDAKKIAQEAFTLRLKLSQTGKLVYAENSNFKVENLQVEAIITSERVEFAEMNLWNLYQTIHENLGGNFARKTKKISFQVVGKEEGSDKEVVKNRSIRSRDDIDDKVRFNKELMDLMKTNLTKELIAA
jgi:hypothetical protein